MEVTSREFTAGVPSNQVALWAGNGLKILLAMYINCINGSDDDYKRRIRADDLAQRLHPELNSSLPRTPRHELWPELQNQWWPAANALRLRS